MLGPMDLQKWRREERIKGSGERDRFSKLNHEGMNVGIYLLALPAGREGATASGAGFPARALRRAISLASARRVAVVLQEWVLF